jgi:hypothetical protein
MKKFNYKYKTTEEFIKEAIKTHGDKYDYSLVNYINAKTKVNIICPIHGEFEQTPRYHIAEQNCPKCSGRYMDGEYFKEKANLIHDNKFDYSLVNYINNTTPIKIICPIHGEFEQKPKDHLLGKSCSKCSGKYMDTEYFKEKANLIHEFKYCYDETIYNNSIKKVIIICPIHGHFEQTPNAHLNGKGCNICKESKGEKEIRNYLLTNNVKFIKQYKFDDCKRIKPLPFDFYLPDYNTCVEYNGEQHYKPIKYFGGESKFKKQIDNDMIKINYCKENKINLLIINDLKKIKETLNSLIK